MNNTAQDDKGKKTDSSDDGKEFPLLAHLHHLSSQAPALTCRICLSESNPHKFLSPCRCKGTIGYVHRNCLERWLEERHIDQCELCDFPFETVKTRKSLWNWFIDPNSRIERRNLLADFMCFLCLTPLGLASFWLCLQGALLFYAYGDGIIEAACLMSLAIFLSFAYFTWIAMSLRYHYVLWNHWKARNWNVHVVVPHLSKSCLKPDHEETVKAGPSLVHEDSDQSKAEVTAGNDDNQDDDDLAAILIITKPRHVHEK